MIAPSRSSLSSRAGCATRQSFFSRLRPSCFMGTCHSIFHSVGWIFTLSSVAFHKAFTISWMVRFQERNSSLIVCPGCVCMTSLYYNWSPRCLSFPSPRILVCLEFPSTFGMPELRDLWLSGLSAWPPSYGVRMLVFLEWYMSNGC